MAEFTLELNDDQKQVRDWLHGFAADVIRPAASEWDEREETPWPVIQEAAKVGIYSLDFYAQQFFDPTGLGIPMAMEELFWGDAGIALSIVGTGLAAVGVLANGTEEQIGTWIPQMYGDPDDVKVAAFCSSEPDAGSDVASMRTRAVYDQAKDEWVLNGTKTWATNGGIANVHVVVAVVDPELGSKGHASFIVPPATPGLSQGQKFKKHGIRASHTAEVVLEDVRIPGHCLLGGKEKLDQRLARARERAASGGERVKNAAMATFEASRPAVGAMAVGTARAAYEVALDYAKTRTQFGRPIIDNQGIAFQLADMRTQIDAARLLVWRASWMATTGKPFTSAEGSMSKLYASETAKKVTAQAVQILGGNGFTREYPVERMHRDAAIYTIFEGTSEIQRLVIARTLSGMPIR
ncbi:MULTISPECIES: acyl-CoA dehydrogenase family protein [unclassified Streptomyces]|uniref:acyl-CoA dehydrogenase family protein n=1 Tax=unclassified Streptomyces TaxID=2593676 RepID=UPI000F5BCF8D|nr:MULTISPECIES: acyl-CoA dehydrogenase family protein [unclassified Streptomyces]WSG49313.1 acyl-CoA dehydrogenase family protein [Streptomyces sp. NBC_01732]WSW99966.1 acyl-CoA dehydrogenase family protein [Streptomyces sp. NBC_00987]MCX4398255.1 acyl-CoA dehydrogenase family protein [Streptomyces sp. NBC_01767]MCX5099039.1 acyl-CoA dehydrogenase family protein [Streptomyces sp. NBC_00439]MCX5158575.1 acyl-CoA dehydrogenase family protein [Streptomyces sp. NBC_00305]